MTTMSQLTIDIFQRQLNSLAHILNKAEDFAKEKGISETEILQAKLAEDMFPLVRQFQIVTDHIKAGLSRLSGQEIPSWPDDEKDFAELHARIKKTQDFVANMERNLIDNTEEKLIEIKNKFIDLKFSGRDYILGYAQPNIYFHLTTAYGILRNLGVQLGKLDYFGRS